MAGREALHSGLITRMGDGSSISVWNDKWIPGTISMPPIFRPQHTIVERVFELIDPSNWSWRQELV